MNRLWMTMLALVSCTSFLSHVAAGEVDDPAPWQYASPQPCPTNCCETPITPPMFGDLFQFGFNFGGGFQGGFQGGFNFSGGFNFQGGFNFSGGGFQGGFNFGAPVAVARGAYKIAENGSPRPVDRIFTTYNYYNNVLDALDVHREMLGFEKTFADGNGSVEMRLPFIQNRANATGESDSDIGDLTAILKYAWINTPDTVLSTGLVVTAPTGPIPTALIFHENSIEHLHPWLLQPFIGYHKDINDFFVRGFSSIMVPTDWRDGTFLFNDIGIGYRLYNGPGLLSAIIPTFETHINTPLTNRGNIGYSDSVDLTAGSYFLLNNRLSIGAAVGTPVTGPRLFDFEAILTLNWFF